MKPHPALRLTLATLLLPLALSIILPSCSADPADHTSTQTDESVDTASQELRGCNDYVDGAAHVAGTCPPGLEVDCKAFCKNQPNECYQLSNGFACYQNPPHLGAPDYNWMQKCYCQKCPRNINFSSAPILGTCPAINDPNPPAPDHAAFVAAANYCMTYCGKCDYLVGELCAPLPADDTFHIYSWECECHRP